MNRITAATALAATTAATSSTRLCRGAIAARMARPDAVIPRVRPTNANPTRWSRTAWRESRIPKVSRRLAVVLTIAVASIATTLAL
jgi:hypothetical protein